MFSRAVHKTNSSCFLSRIPHAAPHALSSTCHASQEPRPNLESRPASQKMDQTTLSTTSTDQNVQLPKSWIPPTSPRQELRDTTSFARARDYHYAAFATVTDHSINSTSHNTTIPRCVQRPTQQTTIPRELTEALHNKTRLHQAQEGSVELEEKTRRSACASWNKSHEVVASGVSVGLVHAPAVFIVAVRVQCVNW